MIISEAFKNNNNYLYFKSMMITNAIETQKEITEEMTMIIIEKIRDTIVMMIENLHHITPITKIVLIHQNLVMTIENNTMIVTMMKKEEVVVEEVQMDPTTMNVEEMTDVIMMMNVGMIAVIMMIEEHNVPIMKIVQIHIGRDDQIHRHLLNVTVAAATNIMNGKMIVDDVNVNVIHGLDHVLLVLIRPTMALKQILQRIMF